MNRDFSADHTELLLTNWGRWLRVRPAQGRCASIEHRFNWKKRPDDTPTGWGDWHWSDMHAIQFQAPVDTLQALEVERVMRWIPEGHRKALFLFYVVRFPYRICCKRLHLGYDRWGKFLSDAQLMVANRLTRHEKREIIAGTIRHPAIAETPEPVGSGCIG